MPVAAASQLLYVSRTVFDAGRTVDYSAAFDAIMSGQTYVISALPAASLNTYLAESRTYLRQRGKRVGFGLSANADGSYALTFFGR